MTPPTPIAPPALPPVAPGDRKIAPPPNFQPPEADRQVELRLKISRETYLKFLADLHDLRNLDEELREQIRAVYANLGESEASNHLVNGLMASRYANEIAYKTLLLLAKNTATTDLTDDFARIRRAISIATESPFGELVQQLELFLEISGRLERGDISGLRSLIVGLDASAEAVGQNDTAGRTFLANLRYAVNAPVIYGMAGELTVASFLAGKFGTAFGSVLAYSIEELRAAQGGLGSVLATLDEAGLLESSSGNIGTGPSSIRMPGGRGSLVFKDAVDLNKDPASLRAGVLVGEAKSFYRGLTRDEQNTVTVAISVRGGRTYVAVNGSVSGNAARQAAYASAVKKIEQDARTRGYIFIRPTTSDHAEVSLYRYISSFDKNFRLNGSIGISNSFGPCGDVTKGCTKFFTDRNFTNLFYSRTRWPRD